MAKLKGRPTGIADGAAVTGTLRFPRLHQSGQGYSAPEYRVSISRDQDYWQDLGTGTDWDGPLSGPGDAAPSSNMVLTLTVTQEGRSRSAVMELLPVVGEDGVLDLAQPQNAVQWVSSATLRQLEANAQAATDAANIAIKTLSRYDPTLIPVFPLSVVSQDSTGLTVLYNDSDQRVHESTITLNGVSYPALSVSYEVTDGN